MKLEGDYLFEASVSEVWSALFDPVILAAVMPGCEKLELVDGHYVGEIKVKVGPIQGKFTGKVDLKDKDEPHSYTMVVDGRGAPGFIKATAHVKLAPEGEATRVAYDSDAQIGGKIASVGQRLIEASARAIVAQSLEGLHTNIKLRAAAYREAAARHAAEAPANEVLAVAATVAPADGATVAPADGTAIETPAVAAAEASVTTAAAQATSLPSALGVATDASSTPVMAVAAALAPATALAPAMALAPAVAATTPSVATTPPAVATPAATATGPSTIAPLATTAPSTIAALPDAAPAATFAATSASAASGSLPAAARTVAPAVAFTPVKTKQSALANAVAKEVASSLFPRSVLVAIILIQALVIVWLAVRH